MTKKNCWEFMRCGRQAGGDKVQELGECPVSKCFTAHGINDGINGGRSCWAIAGSFCGGDVQGSFANKIMNCANCDFAHYVQDEEKGNLVTTPEIVEKIKRG